MTVVKGWHGNTFRCYTLSTGRILISGITIELLFINRISKFKLLCISNCFLIPVFSSRRHNALSDSETAKSPGRPLKNVHQYFVYHIVGSFQHAGTSFDQLVNLSLFCIVIVPNFFTDSYQSGVSPRGDIGVRTKWQSGEYSWCFCTLKSPPWLLGPFLAAPLFSILRNCKMLSRKKKKKQGGRK